MTRPLLEVADIVRAQGERFIESNFRWIHWGPSQSPPCHRTLSHGGSRRTSRPVPSLWLSRHLVQQLPQSALPKVPMRSPR